MSAFSRNEYLRRLDQTRMRMAAQGVDVLLVTSPENIYYLTGYEGWSFYSHQLAVVPPGNEQPLLLLRDMDVACAEFTSFLAPDSVMGYPEDYVGRHDRHPCEFFAAAIEERGWGAERLGVEMDAYYFTARAREELQRGLPGARFVDATLLVNWVRLVKSPTEIEYMRQAAEIADSAMLAGVDAVAPGRRECDAAAAIYQAQVSGTPDFGGDYPVVLLMAVGERTRAPHLTATDARFAPNTAIQIELGGCRRRYHAGLSRTIFLGRPPRALRRLADVTVAGMEAALAAVSPGVACQDVEAAWRRVIERAGYEKESRIGYSIGLGFQPVWVEGTASLQRGDTTTMEPGMCFHMILGMWKGEHNFEISETFVVTEDGRETLSDLPRALLTH
jgi:Xaa-Pro dipeptidase